MTQDIWIPGSSHPTNPVLIASETPNSWINSENTTIDKDTLIEEISSRIANSSGECIGLVVQEVLLRHRRT